MIRAVLFDFDEGITDRPQDVGLWLEETENGG